MVQGGGASWITRPLTTGIPEPVSPPVRQGVKTRLFLRWVPLQPLQRTPRSGEGQVGEKKKILL